MGPNYANPYICTNCVNPNSPIFTLKKAKDLGIECSEAANRNNGEYMVFDKKATKVLSAVARIAAVEKSGKKCYFLAKELGNSGKKSRHKLTDIDVVDEQVILCNFSICKFWLVVSCKKSYIFWPFPY